jgi:hypothetical protein
MTLIDHQRTAVATALPCIFFLCTLQAHGLQSTDWSVKKWPALYHQQQGKNGTGLRSEVVPLMAISKRSPSSYQGSYRISPSSYC